MPPGDDRRSVLQPVTFTTLLRRNRNVRLLWLGQVVSQLGDWFNSIALYAVLLDVTGSATAVAAMMVVQLAPTALVGPWAGVIVDRLNRQRVLVASDLVRGVLMLGLLLVRDASSIWLAYVVVGLSVTATGFFEPARSALLPNIADVDELVPANALSSATWSAMLAIGAGLGGVVTALFGREAAFLLNALSFFLSAVFIARMRPGVRASAMPPRKEADTGFLHGLRFVAGNRSVRQLVSVKAAWSLAGGVLLLLTVFGERVFPLGGGSAGGMGVLYSARGIGAGLGALATRWLCGSDPNRLRQVIAPGFLICGVSYMCFALAPSLPLASLAVVVAHAGGSLLWVSSTVLLQLSVPDRLRGRVFGIDFALMTLVTATMSYATGWALDALGFAPRTLAMALGSLFFLPAAVWSLRWRRP